MHNKNMVSTPPASQLTKVFDLYTESSQIKSPSTRQNKLCDDELYLRSKRSESKI